MDINGAAIYQLETRLHKVTRELEAVQRAIPATKEKREKIKMRQLFEAKRGERASIINRIAILTKG